MKVLLSGDLHIGRASSRVPQSISRDDLRAAQAWLALVDLAIEQRVSLVCLSGDVTDQDNRFWEAVGPLDEGIRRLGDAGIRTIAVAGNHDHDVLCRLADQLPAEHFSLLGHGGHWERTTINVDGDPVLHVDGWSFPQQVVRVSPIETYDLPPDPALPILGIVHGDLDAPASRYGPLDLTRLRATPPSGWLLGHIHAPRLIADPGQPWVLYPGSPQALDPGEQGFHGVWLMEVEHRTCGVPQPLPLSSVWYDQCHIDLTTVDEQTDLEAAILGALREKAAALVEQAGPRLGFISLRLSLTGHTPLAHEVAKVTSRLAADLDFAVGNAAVTVEKVDNQSLPAIDLAQHADTHTAPGALSRLLIDMQNDQLSTESAELIRRIKQVIRQAGGGRDFAGLPRREVTDELAEQFLRSQAQKMLTQLIMQSP